MQQGYIKLYRKLRENPLWKACGPNRKVIMITMLLSANHKNVSMVMENGDKITILPGQFITSRRNFAKECGKGITEQMIRSAWVVFEKQGFSTIKTTQYYTLVTIENWIVYQDSVKKQPSNQPKLNPSSTTNKNEKNEKNKIYTSQCDELWKMYPNKKGKGNAYKKIPKLIEKYSLGEIKRCIERYSKEVEGKDKQYIKHGDTFFNSGYIDYLDENYKSEQQDPVKENVVLFKGMEL